MSEKGIVIFNDGTTLSFGIYVCPDDEQYAYTATHEKSFINEIVPSVPFKLSEHIYNYELDFYHNLPIFSLEGLITILNKKQSTDSPSEILAFVPNNPTEEQLNILKENKMLTETSIQNVNEFLSYDYNDKIKYSSLNDYINEKLNIRSKQNH